MLMKKILLAAVALLATATSAFADKTVTFDFSKPADYGYAAPGTETDHQETPLAIGDKIVSGDVTITAVTKGSYAPRFWNTAGDITFRMTADCSVAVEAGGATIKSIVVTGKNLAATNVTVDCGTWTDGAWTGSSAKVTLVRANSTVQMKTMAVTYEAAETGAAVEKFVACTTEVKDGAATTTAADVFLNATVADGQSHVTFGTDNMTVDAVAGTTPKNVETGTPGAAFPGWTAGWNDVKWDVKQQNIDDAKTNYFGYIVGTGNPYTAIASEEITTDGVATGNFRPLYTYYLPDGSKGMPISGLYYKFQPKADGALKVKVWSNKGSRNTFVVDGETKLPIPYTAEGYINGQKEGSAEDGTSAMKYLSNEEVYAHHMSISGVYDAETNTDKKPYVIGGGNQNFWGYVLFKVTKGKEYRLFQDSSQIGFGGYEFTVGSTDGIADVPVAQPQAKTGRTYNIAGQVVGSDYRGIVIRDGKKHIQK